MLRSCSYASFKSVVKWRSLVTVAIIVVHWIPNQSIAVERTHHYDTPYGPLLPVRSESMIELSSNHQNPHETMSYATNRQSVKRLSQNVPQHSKPSMSYTMAKHSGGHQAMSNNHHGVILTRRKLHAPEASPSDQVTAGPLVKIQHSGADGKMTPTLTITFGKKRKHGSNGRRFPLLKALVSSLMTNDRRLTSSDFEPHRKSHAKYKSTLKSSHTMSASPSSLASINVNRHSDQITSAGYAQRMSANHAGPSMPATSHQGNTALSVPQQSASASGPSVSLSALNGQAVISASSSPSLSSSSASSPAQSLSSQLLQPTSSSSLSSGGASSLNLSNRPHRPSSSSELDDRPAVHDESFGSSLPKHPDVLPIPGDEDDEEEEEEFNEHSDAPRPSNYDEKQYYIEANRVKYVGREFDQMPNPDSLDTDDSDHGEKRPSISVRARGLISVLSKMMRSVNFTMITEDMRLGSSSRASCLACHALTALYLSPFYSKEAMVNAARSVCISFRLQPARVCTGLIDSFKDDLDYIRTHTKLNRREMCGVLFGLKCSRISSPNLNWSVAIPRRPNSIERRNHHSPSNREMYASGSSMYPNWHYNSSSGDSSSVSSKSSSSSLDNGSMASGSMSSMSLASSNLNNANGDLNSISGSGYVKNPAAPLLQIIQITDIHVDPYYVPGSNADCGEPLCCRHTSGPPKHSSKAAGVWGDYRNCDTPVNTLRNTLKQISENHPNVEYWMWTGDISPHDIWNITKEEIIYQIQLVSGLMKEYSKVPVFPVIGNHEGVPVNSFAPPEVKGKLSVAWLYKEVADQWAFWLPEDALKTLRYGGYYMVRVRSGLRVVCLNTNYCTRLNPWTLLDPVDPGEQLQWLAKQLQAAEASGDKVHILGHIPPDNRECTQAWLHNFLRILDRFEHVVLAQYYGHTHRDEFRVLYSPNSPGLRPISVAYVGPSVTPFTENNPAYRVYSMDHQGYIQDHSTYFFNLTEANSAPGRAPKWQLEYSASQVYPLNNLGPEGWHQLVYRMLEDERLLHGYYQRYYRQSLPRQDTVCKDKCKHSLINDIMVAHPLRTKPRRLFGSRKH